MMTTSARFVAVVACAVLCDGLTRTIGRSAFAPARSPLPANDRARRRGAGASLTMKRKGKGAGGGGRVPGTGPPVGVQEQQRAYADYQKTRETSGLPSFDLYVKGPKSPTWYPAGSLGGDDKSRDLVEQYMGGLLSGVAKGGIDRGVAASLFPEKDKRAAGAAGARRAPSPRAARARVRLGSSRASSKPTPSSSGPRTTSSSATRSPTRASSRSGPRPRRSPSSPRTCRTASSTSSRRTSGSRTRPARLTSEFPPPAIL